MAFTRNNGTFTRKFKTFFLRNLDGKNSKNNKKGINVKLHLIWDKRVLYIMPFVIHKIYIRYCALHGNAR